MRCSQSSPISPLSGEKISFLSRPSRALMCCLCRPSWACFFFSAYPQFLLIPLSLNGDYTAFSHLLDSSTTAPPGSNRAGNSSCWCRSPTRPPKPHTRLHRAEFWFSLQNEVTPPPKGGGAGFYSTWSCSASLGSCLWQLLVTNGSRWLNRAGLGLRWCRSPTRPPTPHTGPHRAEFGVYHFFLERFCPGRTAKSRSSL